VENENWMTEKRKGKKFAQLNDKQTIKFLIEKHYNKQEKKTKTKTTVKKKKKIQCFFVCLSASVKGTYLTPIKSLNTTFPSFFL